MNLFPSADAANPQLDYFCLFKEKQKEKIWWREEKDGQSGQLHAKQWDRAH